MIRSEHSIVEYDFQRMTVAPDRLRRVADADYVPAAKQMLAIYRGGIGDQRRGLHGRIEACLTRLGDCPPRRIAAFCKLLDDQSQYESRRKAAATLRRQVFDLAAAKHPIVESREGIFEFELHQVRREIARAIGREWSEIEADLFADVLELQRLESFADDLTPQQLLSLYNLSQTQAALYRATRIRIDATDDFKAIVKQAKLAQLMHRIEAFGAGGDRPAYRFILDGPQTSLRETTRYGVRFAAMLPKLLACRGWRLTAEVVGPRRQTFRMTLSDKDGLLSVLDPPAEFDSGLEADVDAAWQRAPVDGWQWRRESQLLVRGQSVMTPDFMLHHPQTETTVSVEVVGFWTPEYLEEKCRRLREFARQDAAGVRDRETVRWLLIVAANLAPDRQTGLAELGIPIVVFHKKSDPQTWIDAIG
jgi:predicted nuclease of restriction endonuclease-like RecB superfamily